MNRQLKEQEFQTALQRAGSKNGGGNPYQFAKLFDIPIPTLSTTTQPPTGGGFVASSCYDDSGSDWCGIVTILLDTLDSSYMGNVQKCYENQISLHSQFNQIFASSLGNWLVPALHTVCKSTHRIAIQADAAPAGSSNTNAAAGKYGDNTKLENAVKLLQESFSRTYNDRKELRSLDNFPNQAPTYDLSETSSKKIGVVGIVNELFAIYFRLNTLRLCKNLVKPVEAKKLHIGTTGGVTTGQLVTYKYYTGRLHLFEDAYIDAEQNLEEAYTLSNSCPSSSIPASSCVNNQRRILRYLIPVKLYRGRLPSLQLLEKYNLTEFITLVDSIKKGDLLKFNTALIDYQHRFIRQGTYLLLEKCKTVCYRNLFKRIHYVITTSTSNAAQHHQISLHQIRTVFHWLHMLIDLDEIECILANLIYRGYVRGYIAHTKRILVLSKRDPFPLSSVVAK